MVEALNEKYEEALEVKDVKPDFAIAAFGEIIAAEVDDDSANKVKENSIYGLGQVLAKMGRAAELGQLLTTIRPFFSSIPKAKTAKIVRSLIDLIAEVPDTLQLQIDLCLESIAWCKESKRTFLRQRVETKLALLYYKAKRYAEAIEALTPLTKEVKKLDDKALLVEIYLVESKVQHALRNLPKTRTSLTAARTAANAIYCPPLLQGEIDMQAGTLHADEKDYKTSYSYFYEAFEGFNSLDNPTAVQALKYMLLSKIMLNLPEDVHSILSGKLALKYAGRDLSAMKAIADAHKSRSLQDFEKTLKTYAAELQEDILIKNHLSELYGTMLEQNLIRIIEPFSCVEISHISELIQLPVASVEKKLSQMVLDKKFSGILDQGNGWLIVFTDPPANETYDRALETVENMGKVVESLFENARQLM
mmetsp:Transcript_406/g.1409  ORF Transcript_406/g.1409 Transcript_406/m.1409 type:complete len:420 (-) Transcript_406:68-1327(-)